MFTGLDAMIRNMEGQETSIRYDQLMDTTNLLMSSAPGRFNNVGAIHKMLAQLADVSRDSNAFNMASQAVTRMLAEGKVDAQHIRELSVDTGYSFAVAMGLKPGQKVGNMPLEALFAAFDKITSPGGAAFGHAKAQMDTLEGLHSRFLAHWTDFQEAFGGLLEEGIKPIADTIFSWTSPAQLTHAFDGYKEFFHNVGEWTADFMQQAKMFADAGGGRFQEAFKPMQAAIARFQGFIGGFFKEFHSSDGSVKYAMNESGMKAAENVVNELQHIFGQNGQFLNGIGQVANWVSTWWVKIHKAETDLETWLAKHNLMNGFGIDPKKNASITPEDRVRNAQEKLNAMLLGGGTQEQIDTARRELQDAEAAQKANTQMQAALKDSNNALKQSVDPLAPVITADPPFSVVAFQCYDSIWRRLGSVWSWIWCYWNEMSMFFVTYIEDDRIVFSGTLDECRAWLRRPWNQEDYWIVVPSKISSDEFRLSREFLDRAGPVSQTDGEDDFEYSYEEAAE